MAKLMTLLLQIVSHDKDIFSGEVYSLACQTAFGSIEIRPGHAPLLATLAASPVVYSTTADQERHIMAISGGILEVTPKSVRILSDSAEIAHDIDESMLTEEITKNQQLLTGHGHTLDQESVQAAKTELAYALARLAAIHRLKLKR